MYELVGYAASVLVAISLMMSSILRLRIINLIGAALFSAYGVLIGAAPVAVVNLFIVGINIFHLWRIYGSKEYFRILEVSGDSKYLDHYLALKRADIERYDPGFTLPPPQERIALFVLRDVIPAGVFVGEQHHDCMDVRLDYVLPGYRDFKIGAFLFDESSAFFRARGIRRLAARARTDAHARYLRRMGFEPEPALGPEAWRRSIG